METVATSKDFLNLAKVYRSIGNSIGAGLITLAGYFGGSMLLMLFPLPYDMRYNSLWYLYIFLTLAICTTSLAFTCFRVVHLHKASKSSGIPQLTKHSRFWIATTCISITFTAWSLVWMFLSMFYYYDGFHMEYLRIWPAMPYNVETWLKLMLSIVPAISIAIVYFPIAWKQLKTLAPVFPPPRSQWFPSAGQDGVKWGGIALKLGWIVAFSAVFIPFFITFTYFRSYSDPFANAMFPYMITGIVASSISVGAHGFAAIVAAAKSEFKLARGFIEIYREQAGLPRIPDGYRIPPGLLTRPLFFSMQEDDLNPSTLMGRRPVEIPRAGVVYGNASQEDGKPGYQVINPAHAVMEGEGGARSWYIPADSMVAVTQPGAPVRTITPLEPVASSSPVTAGTPAKVPTPATNQDLPQHGNAVTQATVASPPIASTSNPPAIPARGKERVPEAHEPAVPKPTGENEELKLDFSDVP